MDESIEDYIEEVDSEIKNYVENLFMDYDKSTGKILGFYTKTIHGDDIPKDCIEITPEKHLVYIGSNGRIKINTTTLEDEECENDFETENIPLTQDQLKMQNLEAENIKLRDTINFILINY